jgi:hypothetical protein
MNTQNLLQDCHQSFGSAPRQHNFWQHQTYLKIPRPKWAGQDRLNTFFEYQNTLLKQGFITWGATVQANNHLFYSGKKDLPAEVVFCTNPQQTANPDALAVIARNLYRLKNTTPEDPELAKFAAKLTDEYDRHFGIPLPQSLSPEFPAELSTFFVARRHLPNGYLSQSYFPLLVAPDRPRVVMILPSRYWSEAMVDWWIGKTAIAIET